LLIYKKVVDVLTMSEVVLDAFAKNQKLPALKELYSWLVIRDKSLGRDPTIPERLKVLVDWAESLGIGMMADIYLMADFAIRLRIDLHQDADFRAAVSADSMPHEAVMLNYLRSKPPAFWQGFA